MYHDDNDDIDDIDDNDDNDDNDDDDNDENDDNGDDNDDNDDDRYIGDDYTFIINRAKVPDRGEFIIRAENHYGVSEEPVFLNVQAAPTDIKPYQPDPLPVRKREPKKFRNYNEERDAAPIFTFHLRPRIIQEGQTCKLLACLTGQPHPTVSIFLRLMSSYSTMYLKKKIAIHSF